MKKIAIAGASVALAAMPIVGVFADGNDGNSTATDIVTVTVQSACTLTATQGEGWSSTTGYSGNIVNGADATFGSTSLKVVCNDVGGWAINAIGGDGTTTSTVMDATGSGTDIATSTTFSGESSAWGMRVFTEQTGSYQPTIDGSYDSASFKVVPSSAEKVAHGGTTDQTTGSTVKTQYKVYISPTQQADTYTGKVTYTLVHPNPTTPAQQPEG